MPVRFRLVVSAGVCNTRQELPPSCVAMRSAGEPATKHTRLEGQVMDEKLVDEK
jgi:hypothetical protein